MASTWRAAARRAGYRQASEMQLGKVLVFDLGGVLVENGGRAALTAMLPQKAQPGDVRLRWLASSVVQQFERGRISSNEFASSLVKEWGLELDPL